jgi:LysM domain-containing protein
MIERPMRRRNPARWLAPIALVAAAAGTYVVVHSNLTAKATHAHHASRSPDLPRGRYRNARFYVVQTGDSFSTISTKTGVPVPTLRALNPKIDPSALQPGQRVRLQR